MGCCTGADQESRVHGLTVRVSSPECMNSELLEELMSSEGESLRVPLTVWPFSGRKTTPCDFTQLTALRLQARPHLFWPRDTDSVLTVAPVPARDQKSLSLPYRTADWKHAQRLLLRGGLLVSARRESAEFCNQLWASLSPVFAPLLRLSPPPGDHDYIYNLDESEGVCDLFDVPVLNL